MDAKLQRRVQRYGWDKAAGAYERSWAKQLEPAQTMLLDMAAIEAGVRVLDVACGSGLVTLRAAARIGAKGQAIGTDISEQMVAAARENAVRAGLTHVRFERMDAEDLQFEDASFDVVLCALGLMYVPDPRKALREFHRVLRPGGRAVAAVWGQRDKCGWAELFPIVDARVQSEVCPLFFGLGTGSALQQTFEAVGFGACRSARLHIELLYRTDEEACEAAFLGGPVALAYDRFAEMVRGEAREEYLSSIQPYRTEEGYAIPGEFVVVAGTK
jgi:ubiquinone/menaquinone biosynthesis C-methylase UbiE